MIKKLLLISVFLFLPLTAWAHQPRLASGVEMQTIEEPEVSKAYYGALKGAPEYYQIVSEHDFKFYVNILAPDLADSKKDFKVEVYDGDYSQLPFLFLDGETFVWEKYYEKYAGDSYYKGPEQRLELKAGTYTIKVYSASNQGKYVLAVGEKETFGLAQIWEMVTVLPIIKMEFFNKSPFMILYSALGQWLVIGLLAILVLILIFVALIRLIEKNTLKKIKKHKKH